MESFARQRLARQTQDVERVLAQFQLEGRVSASHQERGAARFTVPDCGPIAADTWERLEETLCAECGAARVELTLQGADLDIALFSPAAPALLSMLDEEGLPAPGYASLGKGVDGRFIQLSFGEPGANHVLFVGDAQAGKTAALRTCALSLALSSRQAQIQMIFMTSHNEVDEGYGPGLQTLHYLPHALTAVAADLETSAKTLAFVTDELAYRRQRRITAPSIVLFMDDVHLLLGEGGAPIREPLRLLLAGGADYGIYLVMAARPGADVESDELGDVLALTAVLRIVGRIEDERLARVASGFGQSGAQHLQGKGDFLLMGDDGPRRFQAAFVDAYDLVGSIEWLHQKRTPSLQAQCYV